MSKELEHALYQAVVFLLQARAYAMAEAGQSEARDEVLGYLEALREAYLKPTAYPATAEGELKRQADFAAQQARQRDEWERCGEEGG